VPDLKVNYESLPNALKSKELLDEEFGGLAGFLNLGNTCYINSALQCLTNTQPLVDYFLAGIYEHEINSDNPAGTRGELARGIGEIICIQWLGDYEKIAPKYLVSVCQTYSPQFSVNEQHDSHEFLVSLLDKLHEDLNRVREPQSCHSAEHTVTEEVIAALKWEEHLQSGCSVIVDLFQGQLKSTVRCTKCPYVSVTFDTFMYLSLPLPKTKLTTLQECLAEFTKEEQLEADQLWVCPVCLVPNQAMKKFDIWKVPPVLVIHLKRFKTNRGASSKVSNLVRYPVDNLILSNFTAGPQREAPLYELFAKIDHEGSLAEGHYTATVRHRTTGRWHTFDDDRVVAVRPREVVTNEAYLLFYQKASVTKYLRQDKDLPEHWPHVLNGRRPSRVNRSYMSETLSSSLY
jgi:ubiquitin carboxyl-terminal hydrolase 8